MTTYRKTMAEALKEVYLGENNLEKMRKASKGAAQTLKMKDGNLKMDSFTASAIMQIYDKINDKNKKTFEKMMKDGKKADIMKLQKFAMSKISSEYVPEEFEEEFELDEAELASPPALAADPALGSEPKLSAEPTLTASKLNIKKIHKAVDDGKSMDVIVGMFADRRTTNTDEIRKIVRDYKFKKRMKEEVELDESKGNEKSQGMFVVLEKGTKNKVIGQFKTKKKAMEMMKKSAGSKVIQIGKFATVDDKPVDIKVGDELSYTRVKLSKKIKEEVELDEEMKYNFVVLDRLGKVVAFTSKEFDAKVHAERGHQKDSPSKGKGIVGRNSSSAYKLKKPISQKKGDMMINKSFDIKPGDKKIFDKGFSVKEEVELDEAKYDLYHKDFSSAMQHAYAMAKKLYGITIDPKEIDDKVATGPSKPGSGKTNKYRLKGDKGAIQVQVYNKGGSKPFELNMYKEEVELGESVSVKDFDSLKKGDTVTIQSKSVMGGSKEGTYKVTGKNVVGKDKVEKVTLKNVKNPGGVKNFLYKRDNKVGFAQGDMAASVVSFKKEEVELDESKKALKAKSEKSGVSVGILSKVYDRGMAAWKTGHRPGTTPQQLALARVNSFLTGGGARKADNDLWQQAKKQKAAKKEEFELDEGTWALPDTPKKKATLKNILSKPLPVGKEGDDASKVMGGIIGDDELMDDFYSIFKKSGPKADGRPAIKAAMMRLTNSPTIGMAMKRFGMKEEVEIAEDGHADVPSAVRQCKTVMEDATQILSKLMAMGPEDSLPTWWTNKLAIASNSMNKMRDYLLVPSEMKEQLEEAKGDLEDLKKVVAELEKASKMHLAQSKRVQAHIDMMSESVNEQPEHEITVGGYTTKFFYMCGTAQEVMKKNADVEGAEEITKLQDDFYKLEKDVMDAGSATDGQKILAKEIYNKIMKLAGEAGLADDIDNYMKMHLDSIEKGDPKPGFGRTDIKEEVELGEMFGISSNSNHRAKTMKMLDGMGIKYKKDGRNGLIILGVAPKDQKGILDKIHKDIGMTTYRIMDEEVDLGEASARADAMRAMRRGKSVDPADVDTDATDDDVKSASKNIMMQLRKSVSLRGNFPVEFMDKKKVKIPMKIAQAVLNKHNSFRKPMDKEKFQAKVSKSHRDLLSALKEKKETKLNVIHRQLRGK